MKRLVTLLLTLCLVIPLISCEESNPPLESQPPDQAQATPQATPPAENGQEDIDDKEGSEDSLEGKIAIVTDSPVSDISNYNHLPIVAEYGEEKIVTIDWPDTYSQDDVVCKAIEEMGKDPAVKAMIVNPILTFGNMINALERLQEEREDILLVYCLHESMLGSESLLEYTKGADLVLALDAVGIGAAMVRQAHKLGANTFVYCPSRWGASAIEIARRDMIERECAIFGILFVEVLIPDTVNRKDESEFTSFFYNDFLSEVQKYGEDTAIFSDNLAGYATGLAVPAGLIYPHPVDWYFSPFNAGLGDVYISTWPRDLMVNIYTHAKETIEITRDFLAGYDMLGRVSNWPVPYSFMFTHAATEYAFKWMSGEVPKEGIDVAVLKQLMSDYAGVRVFLTPYTDEETGTTHENILLMRMDYITY